MLDFLYRKIACYYCGEIVRRKDAIQMSLMVQGKVQEKLWICRRCANVIKSINESWKCNQCKKKPKPDTSIIATLGEKPKETKTYSGPQVKYIKTEDKK